MTFPRSHGLEEAELGVSRDLLTSERSLTAGCHPGHHAGVPGRCATCHCAAVLFTQDLSLCTLEGQAGATSFIFVPTLLLPKKSTEILEVHRGGEELVQVPQHTAAKSRNQGLAEKREGRKLGPLVSVLLTCPTPASWPSGQRVTHPSFLQRGGSAFQRWPGPPRGPCVHEDLGIWLPTTSRASLCSQSLTCRVFQVPYVVWFKPLGPFSR